MEKKTSGATMDDWILDITVLMLLAVVLFELFVMPGQVRAAVTAGAK